MTSRKSNYHNLLSVMRHVESIKEQPDDQDIRLQNALAKAPPKGQPYNIRHQYIPLAPSDSSNARVALYDTTDGTKAIIKVCLSAEVDPIHQDAFVLQAISHPTRQYLMGYIDIFTAPMRTALTDKKPKQFTDIYIGTASSNPNPDRYPCILSPANVVTKNQDKFRSKIASEYKNRAIWDKANAFFNALVDLSQQTGFVHNDMHYENILFDEKLDAFVLIDFGRSYIDVGKFDLLKGNYETIKTVFNESVVYVGKPILGEISTIEGMFERAQLVGFTKFDSNAYGIWADIGGLLLSLSCEEWFQYTLLDYCGAQSEDDCPFIISNHTLRLNLHIAQKWWGSTGNTVLKRSLGWIAIALYICSIFRSEVTTVKADISLADNTGSSIDVPMAGIISDKEGTPLYISGIMYTEYFALINKYFKQFESRTAGGRIIGRNKMKGGDGWKGKHDFGIPNGPLISHSVPLTPPLRVQYMKGGRLQKGGAAETIEQRLLNRLDQRVIEKINIYDQQAGGGRVQKNAKTNKAIKTHIKLRGQERVRLVKTNAAGERYVTIEKKPVPLKDIRGRYTYV
jgi:hypothetical protein